MRPNALRLDHLEPLMRKLQRIDAAARERAIRGVGAVRSTDVTGTAALDFALARKVLQTEAAAILALVDRLDERFDAGRPPAPRLPGPGHRHRHGQVGIICRKIAATLSSTGTPAFFLHPAEAIHGDLGVLQADDVIVALSYSGETDELLRLLETIKRLGARLIAITGDPQSTLGKAADVALDCHVSEEACPLNLVPTASTTAALALGDALAMTLLVAKGFRQEDFANLHPGGKLGKRLMRAEQLMHAGEQAPDRPRRRRRCARSSTRSRARGSACRASSTRRGRLAGIITDGDLRRHMARHGQPARAQRAEAVMTRNPVTIAPDTLAVEVLNIARAPQDHVGRRRGRRTASAGRRAPARPVAHGDDLTPRWPSTCPLLAALIALLVGPGRRQGVGALQAAGRPLDRSPPAARDAALHARPEFPRRHQVDQAIDELTQATSTDTDALEIQMILGNLYRQKGQVGARHHGAPGPAAARRT